MDGSTGKASLDPADGSDAELRHAVTLEDYKAWLRELEKQDRWYAETVWALVAALGVTLFPLRKLPDLAERTAAAWGIWAVGAAFIHMSTTFLMFRIPSHRTVSRSVAATRRALGTRKFLARDEIAGAPLVSDNPALFRRSTHRGGAFQFLFLTHQYALAAVTLGSCWVLPGRLSLLPPSGHVWLLIVAAMHFTLLSARFHWRVSEARNVGEFIVTRARDAGVPVHDDAEVRLGE